jgi:hypothetical protein
MSDLKLAIVLGSTRPGRNGEAVADWYRPRHVEPRNPCSVTPPALDSVTHTTQANRATMFQYCNSCGQWSWLDVYTAMCADCTSTWFDNRSRTVSSAPIGHVGHAAVYDVSG